MHALLAFAENNATGVLFHVAAVTMIFSLARMVKVPGPIALFAAFSPLVLAWVLQNPTGYSILVNLF